MLRIRHTKDKSATKGGFTIVELTVVIVILGLLFPIFSVVLINTYKDSFYAKDKVRISLDAAQALRYIEENTRVASAFHANVPSQFSDPYGRNNTGTAGAEAWSYKGTSATNRTLITENYASNANPLNTGRQPVFKNTVAFNCTTEMTYQPQLTFATIYFVKDTVLYRRVLTDTTSPLCAGNTQAQKQTCPPYIAVGSRNATCFANDEILSRNVTNFSMAYYQISIDGTSTQLDPTYSSSDTTILDTADYVNVTLTTSTRNGVINNTVTQRITKVNQ